MTTKAPSVPPIRLVAQERLALWQPGSWVGGEGQACCWAGKETRSGRWQEVRKLIDEGQVSGLEIQELAPSEQRKQAEGIREG